MKTLLLLLITAVGAYAADYPTVIHIGYPGVGNDGFSPLGVSVPGGIAIKGLFEQEFKKEGIHIDWQFFKGAGPALNESLANGLLDFAAGLGDLPAIVHYAGGFKSELLATSSRRQNTYVLVPSSSSATTLQDLIGKRLGIQKGTNASLAWTKLVLDQGFKESDFKTLNLDPATSREAIATSDIDGYVGGSDVFQVRNRGAGRVVFTTAGRNPLLGRFSNLYVTQAFEQKYPQVVQRILDVWVREAAWESDENNRAAVFRLYGKSGQPSGDFKEDFGKDTLASHNSPLLDDHFYHHFTLAIQISLQAKFIRHTIDLNGWVNDKYLKQALKDDHLEGFWAEYDENGNLKTADHSTTALSGSSSK